jgi:hypothetical protein
MGITSVPLRVFLHAATATSLKRTIAVSSTPVPSRRKQRFGGWMAEIAFDEPVMHYYVTARSNPCRCFKYSRIRQVISNRGRRHPYWVPPKARHH